MFTPWGNFLLFFLLLLAPLSLQAQSKVTLEEAIELSKANHPRLKIANAEIERSRISRKEAWEVAPTTFTYSWGQINGENRKDKQIGVSQGIGSVITPYYKNALVNKKVTSGNYYHNIVEKEVVAEVKRAWCYYLFALQHLALYQEQSDMVDQLHKVEDSKYMNGSITLLEKKMSNTYSADIHNKLFQANEELRIASSRLQWACYSDDVIVPADSGVMLLPVSTNRNGLSEVYLTYFRSLTEQKKTLLQIEQSRYFPEFSIGYVRQNILPMKGLDSWMVGVSFPLFFTAQQSRVKQAKIDLFIQQIQQEISTLELSHKLIELNADLLKQSENIRYYTTYTLPEAEQLINEVKLQLKSGNADIIQLIQTLNGVLSIKKSYIETVLHYNITALETELYK